MSERIEINIAEALNAATLMELHARNFREATTLAGHLKVVAAEASGVVPPGEEHSPREIIESQAGQHQTRAVLALRSLRRSIEYFGRHVKDAPPDQPAPKTNGRLKLRGGLDG